VNVPCRVLMPLVQDALGRGQRVRLTSTGSSMLPFLREGDVVELDTVKPNAIGVGDIVLALAGGSYVLHRVTAADSSHVYLSGDAQTSKEGPFERHEIVARVVTVERGGRVRTVDSPVWRIQGLFWTCLLPLRQVLWSARKLMPKHHS
jgi:signal peptidase I